MAAATPPALPDDYAPGPRLRSLIALVLRAGLGFQVLNAGMTGFLHKSLTGGTGPLGSTVFARMGVYPGSEGAYPYLPYVEVVVGLALLLGFLTTVAAAVAAVLMMFPALAEAFVLAT